MQMTRGPWTATSSWTSIRRAARCRSESTGSEEPGGVEPTTTATRVTAPQPERSRPRLHRVVGLAADDGVDDERLQARVPGPARLGGLRVDLGGGEGDLTAVAQDRLAGEVLLAGGCEVGDLALDDGDDRADQVEGLGQRDRPGQLARCGAEDVGGHGRLGLVAAEPVEERRDAGLGDQAHPRAVLGGERPVPLVVGLHLLHGRRSEVPRGTGDPAAGGGRGARAGGRHTGSVFVRLAQPGAVRAVSRCRTPSRRGRGRPRRRPARGGCR